VNALRLCFQAPTAHFALPFVISNRKTYPIPPYSTAIGIICNMIAEKENIEKFINSGFYITVVGNYETLEREYTWLRNLSEKQHKKRFPDGGRVFGGKVEHPGGQSPVFMDTLINARFCIYLQADYEILQMIHKAFQDGKYLSHIHMGRAEDVVSYADVEIINIEKAKIYTTTGYTWLPIPKYSLDSSKDYKKIFDKIGGIRQRINTLYEVKNGVRVFQKLDVKLYSGSIPMLSPFEIFQTFADTSNEFLTNNFKETVPLFFARMVRKGE